MFQMIKKLKSIFEFLSVKVILTEKLNIIVVTQTGLILLHYGDIHKIGDISNT